MDEGAGVYRTRSGLVELVNRLDSFRERFEKVKLDDTSRTFNTELTAALELDFMLDVAADGRRLGAGARGIARRTCSARLRRAQR